MLAYNTFVFAAVAAAAAFKAQSEAVYQRSMLSSMTIEDSQEICSKSQELVCCNKSKDCGSIDVGGLNKSDQLTEHCSADVMCCDFSSKNNIMWSDVTNNCIFASQAA